MQHKLFKTPFRNNTELIKFKTIIGTCPDCFRILFRNRCLKPIRDIKDKKKLAILLGFKDLYDLEYWVWTRPDFKWSELERFVNPDILNCL